MPHTDEDRKQVLATLNADGKLFTTVDSTESAPNLEPIWGNWLFRKCVVFEVGEPGISKTTFNYAFATALVNRQPFLGVDGRYPGIARILYLDLESSDSLIKSRKNMLGCQPSSNLMKCNVPNILLTELEPYIELHMEKYGHFNIIFVDPIRMAFSTRDENDNAEAAKQMKYTRYLSEKWDASIVLVHHSSKAELSGTRKGSGAFARAALADIVWNLEDLGESYPPELFKFYIPKSRLIQDDLCLCIRKEEGGFKVVDFPPSYTTHGVGIRIYSLQQALDVMMQDRKQREPQEMLETLKDMGLETNRATLYRAIIALMQLGALRRAKYGKYEYVPKIKVSHF